MNSNKIFYNLIFYILFLSFATAGQEQKINFSKSDIDEINKEIDRKVRSLCTYLERHATLPFNKNNIRDLERVHDIALNFTDSAKIEISSKNRITPTNPAGVYDTVGYYEYLTQRLPNNLNNKYQFVKIKVIPLDTSMLGQFQPDYKNGVLIGWHGKIRFDQYFIASFKYPSVENLQNYNFTVKPDYEDLSRKEAEITIRFLKTAIKTHWLIKISYISVKETKSIPRR
jgi:hypothetical protein